MFWLLRVQNVVCRVARMVFSRVCNTAAFLALFTSMESLPSKARTSFFKKVSDEMSESKMIDPYFKLPNALHN